MIKELFKGLFGFHRPHRPYSDDSTRTGECPWCGKISSQSYMPPEDRESSSEDSLVCDSCYEDYWNEHQV